MCTISSCYDSYFTSKESSALPLAQGSEPRSALRTVHPPCGSGLSPYCTPGVLQVFASPCTASKVRSWDFKTSCKLF